MMEGVGLHGMQARKAECRKYPRGLLSRNAGEAAYASCHTIEIGKKNDQAQCEEACSCNRFQALKSCLPRCHGGLQKGYFLAPNARIGITSEERIKDSAKKEDLPANGGPEQGSDGMN